MQRKEQKKTDPKNSAEERLPACEKGAFFCANLGNIPVMTMIGSFLLFYYTDVLKLSPVSVGFVFFAARVFGAVCDPFLGYVIDHHPSKKYGRYRPWLAVGSLLTAVHFALLWIGPGIIPAGKMVIVFVTYIFIGPSFASMDISLNSMIPSITRSEKERKSLSFLKGLACTLGGAGITGMVVPFVSLFHPQKYGWYLLAAILSVYIFVFSLIGAFGVRERVIPQTKEKYPARLLPQIFFQTKPVIILFVSSMAGVVGGSIRGGLMMDYLKYYLKSSLLMSYISIINTICVVVGIFVVPFVLNRYAKKKVYLSCAVISSFCMLSTFFVTPRTIGLLLASTAVGGFCAGCSMTIGYMIMAELVDYVEEKLKFRAEGALASMNSFIIKIMDAIGSTASAFVLSASGFIPSAVQQSSQTLQSTVLAVSVVPFGFSLLSALIFLFYPDIGGLSGRRKGKTPEEKKPYPSSVPAAAEPSAAELFPERS